MNTSVILKSTPTYGTVKAAHRSRCRQRQPSRRWPIRLRWHRRLLRIGKRRYAQMISKTIKEFVERMGAAFVGSSDAQGNPHLAAGIGVSVPEANRLVFEAWFCRTTLKNLTENPRMAVAVVDPASGNGYQFFGRVEKVEDTAVLDGFLPGGEPPELPQVQWRLEMRVEEVTAFSAGAHSDRPLG
jgi:hypothetical protein